MCGFAGILNNSFRLYPQQIAAIAQKVSFRGPDSCGIRLYDPELKISDSGNSAVFFNRLSIIDVDSRSDQPFEDDRYTLMFNGEIYNYLELKKALLKEGCIFHTSSDTEVLFYALSRWGPAVLDRLNGMFAFFWLDRKEGKYLLARDRMGIKPLYYRQHRESLVFGSELDSILRLSDNLPPIEPVAVKQFLWMQFVPTPYSIVREVYKLPPGQSLEGSLDGLRKGEKSLPRVFWDAYATAARDNEVSDPAGLEQVLLNSLSRQLVADVPLGFFLSSGVDSSLLAALINKHFVGAQKFNFFTVGFTEATSSDESKDALQFIRGFRNPALSSHTLTIDSGHIGDQLDRLYDYFDEPFGDPTALLNWVISQKARECVTVVLSGDGADELFWGYPRYSQWKTPGVTLLRSFRIGKKMARLMQSVLTDRYMRTQWDLALEPDPLQRHFTLFLHPGLGHLRQQPCWADPIWALEGVGAMVGRQDLPAILDIKTYLADAMLYKVDRAGMAASLEVRVPYLDNEVVDYALALPFVHKSNGVTNYKAALRRLLHDLAPHYPMGMPKKGFNFPLDKWLRLSWRERVSSLLHKGSLADLGLDDRLYMDIVKKYQAGDKRYCIAVWYLLNLTLWYKKYKNIEVLHAS